MNKARKKISILVLLFIAVICMVCAVLLPMIQSWKLSVLASELAESNDYQYLGIGFDVASTDDISDTNVLASKKVYPIVDQTKIEEYVSITNAATGRQGFIKGESAYSFSQKYTNEISFKTENKFSVWGAKTNVGVKFNLGVSSSLTKTGSESYQMYYHYIDKYSVVLQLGYFDVREYLTEQFRKDLQKVTTAEAANELYDKYGTHMIAAYIAGGRLEFTSYAASEEENVSDSLQTDFETTISVDVGKAINSDNEISLSGKYATDTESKDSVASFRANAYGGSLAGGTVEDQIKNAGKWAEGINDGENLTITGIPSTDVLIPVWDLLPSEPEYLAVRQVLQVAYEQRSLNVSNEYYQSCGDINNEISSYLYEVGNNLTLRNANESAVAAGSHMHMRAVLSEEFAQDENFEWVVASAKTKYGENVSESELSSVATVDPRTGVVSVGQKVGYSFELQIRYYGITLASQNYEICNSDSGNIWLGSGTAESPYLISTPNDLVRLSSTTSLLNAHYKLLNDIDMAGVSITPIGIPSVNSSEATIFTGTFDGNGYAIKNLTISQTKAPYMGFFAQNAGVIKNLMLINTTQIMDIVYNTEHADAGGFAAYNTGTIENCGIFNSSISLIHRRNDTNQWTGGDIWYKGWFESKFDYYDDSTALICRSSVGGIVGRNEGESGIIKNCHVDRCSMWSEANVGQTDAYVRAFCGGIAGSIGYGAKVEYCVVSNCEKIDAYTYGGVYEDDNHVGEADSHRCMYDSFAGGIAGEAYTDSARPATIVTGNVAYNCNINASWELAPHGKYTPVTYARTFMGGIFGHQVNQLCSSNYYDIAMGKAWEGDESNSIAFESVQELAGYNWANQTSVWGLYESGTDLPQWYDSIAEGEPYIKPGYGKAMVIDELPIQTVYYIGETVNLQGLKVLLVTSIGEEDSELYTGFTVSDLYCSEAGNKVITLTSGNGLETSFVVSVRKKEVVELTMEHAPYKTIYTKGETLSLSGLELHAVFETGEEIDVEPADIVVTGFDTSALYNNATITLTFGEKSVTYQISVVENSVVSLEITKNPEKTTGYSIIDSFDTTGMEVTATYTDGSSRVLSEDEYELRYDFNLQQPGKVNVEVVYKQDVLEEDKVKAIIEGVSVTKTNADVVWNVNGEKKTESVRLGTVPQYNETIKVPEETAQYHYTFLGWESSSGVVYEGTNLPVLLDKEEYTAVYKQNVNIYSCIFYDDDGKTVIGKYELEYGSIIPTPNDPKKNSTAQYEYSFREWEGYVENAIIEGNCSYQAVYDEIVRTYTVVWSVGETEVSEIYEYGSLPVYPYGVPNKPTDANNKYVFTEWDSEISEVVHDTTYTAQFDEIPLSEIPVLRTETVSGRPGQTVTVTLSFENMPEAISALIYDIDYDASALKLTSAQFSEAVQENAFIGDWDSAESIATVVFENNTDINGVFLTLTFEILEEAEEKDYTVSCKVAVNQESGLSDVAIETEVVPGKVTVTNIARGDLNEDGSVTSKDAIYLLRHTLLPSRYPLNQNGDVNGDGVVNNKDAVYLLRHTLLPSRYPLAN